MKKSLLITHLLVLVFYFNSSGQCLSGAYTIGGSFPDYSTFTSAINALTSNGVCGPVTFHVRAGTYNEQLIIPQITGTSSVNTITFQSENGDSSGVKLAYSSSGSTANYTIKFNGGDYITLKRLTLAATGSSYARVIEIANNSTHNNFLNNAILGIATASSSIDYTLVYSAPAAPSLDSANVFSSNYLQDGSYGLYLCGNTSSSLESGTVISGNTFLNQGSTGVYLVYQRASVLTENLISSNTTQSIVNGINCFYCYTGLKITKNKIYLTGMGAGNGIGLSYCYGTISDYGLIANNFIMLSPKNRGLGIGCSDSNFHTIVFNTVHVTGSNGTPYYHKQSNKIILKNNILSNEKTYAIYVDYLNSSYTGPISDYNDLYSGGPALGYWDGTPTKDLVSWYSYTHGDIHSVSKKPDFVSLSDLHERNVTRFHFGTPLPEITDDIDGQTRSALTDIGADEVTPPVTDAGLLTIKSPVSCTGNQDLTVSLYNFGSDTLRNVTINWKVNDIVQTPFNWVGSLVDSTDVIFGNYAFIRDSVYTLVVWTSSPNGQTDINSSNDAVQTTIKTKMSGSYTIGGTSPDYPSFTAAVNALIRYGICDHVIFNVRPGTYNEQLIIPNIDRTFYLTVTFQSENGDNTSVLLTHASTDYAANYTVKFNRSGNVSFKNISISNTGSKCGRVLEVLESYVNISNNRIIGTPVTTPSDTFALIYSAGSNTFSYDGSGAYSIYNYNTLIDGSTGIYFKTDQPNAIRGVNITHNIFQNQYNYGIYLYHQYGYLVENNVLTSNSAFSGRTGIFCKEMNYFAHCDMLRVRKNTIIFTNPAGDGYGIRLESCFGNKIGTDLFFNIVSNNFISLNVAPGGNPAGIYVQNGEYMNIFNNTVHITGNNTKSAALTSAGNIFNTYVTNNLLSNSAAGYAIVTGGAIISNFNDLYTNGTYLGSLNSSLLNNVPNLQDWITYSKSDKNSKSIKPKFVSDSDLHENYVTHFNYGKPLFEVPDDIDGESRNYLLPDIGADEAAMVDRDANLESILTGDYVCSGINPITVRLINSGNDVLKNLTFNFKINNVLQTPFIWNGTLYTGDTAVVDIGTYNFTQRLVNSIAVWTEQPNGQNDMNAVNDTLYKTIYTSLSGVFTIGGSSPDFPTFNSAVAGLKKFGVCGPVTLNARPGTYAEQVIIPPITGASSVNTITFQSENSDSTSVDLTYSSAIDTLNFTVRLLKLSDFILFKKLTLSATGNKLARVMELQNSLNPFIKVLNCRIRGVSTLNASADYALIYSTSDAKGQFESNVFKDGSYGIYSASPYAGKLIVSNNFFENQFYYGVYNEHADRSLIEKNTFTSSSTDRAFGIYCQGDYTISRNKIIFPNCSGGYAIRCGFEGGTTPGIISNNFIVINTNAWEAYGIYCSAYIVSPNVVKIYNNSVHIIGSNSTSTAYYQDNYNNNNNYPLLVKNNIFSNDARGYSITNAQSAGISSDYNVLYTNGSYVARIKNGSVSNLATWQTNTSQDGHSKSTAPHFVSDTDLHENFLTKYNLGTPLAEVTDDVDGDLRPPLKPDVGADEVMLKANDIGVSTIKKIACEGNNTISVNVFNYGSSTLTNLTVNWKINNVIQPAYNWTGSLASSDSTSITIGTFNFTSNTAYDIVAWTSNPNALSDMDLSNDTAKLKGNQAPLNGTYTIGTSGKNFNGFSAAANYLINYGVCGPVTFTVAPGIYTEQFTLSEIPGASAVNTITFQSQNGDSSSVVLTYAATGAATNYIVRLNGANYITFKKITMTATGNTYARVIEIADYSSNNSFLNNQIIGAATSTTSDNLALVISNNVLYTRDSNLIFKSNVFKNGSYGIYSYGIGSSSNPRTGTVISNNSFINQSYYTIALGYHYSPIITQNRIESGFQNYHAIYCSYCDKQLSVTKNQISVSGDGITLSTCTGNFGLVANNFITLNSPVGKTGIYTSSARNQKILNNTVRVNGSDVNSYSYKQISGTYLILKNNILYNAATGAAIFNNVSSGMESDYNVLYTNGSALVKIYNSPFANLAAWQKAYSQDAHSISVNPHFVSPTDLHIFSDNTINNKGIPFAEVSDDIDGQTRSSSTPDIGADEFDFPVDVNRSDISDIAIYPNPARERIMIEIAEGIITGTVSVYNSDGQEMIKQQISGKATVIDISEFSNGIYVVMLKTDNDLVLVKKIMKAH